LVDFVSVKRIDSFLARPYDANPIMTKEDDLRRLDAWMEKRSKAAVSDPWNCDKGMHRPEWSAAEGFFRCGSCKVALDARRRREEELARSVCGYCGGDRGGVHRVIQRQDGVCTRCSGGDVEALKALLLKVTGELGEGTELRMELEAVLASGKLP
jgi:hypothetical protein